jgi:hypothetical protein
MLRRLTNNYVTFVSSVLLVFLLVFDYLREGYVLVPNLQISTQLVQDLEKSDRSLSETLSAKNRGLADQEESKYKSLWLSPEGFNSFNELSYGIYTQDELSIRLQNELHNLMSIPYDSSKVLLYYHHLNNGFGAEFHWLQVALTVAFMTNRRLVIAEKEGWHYADETYCNHTTWSCYFNSIPPCPSNIASRLAIPIDYSNLDQNDQIVIFSDKNKTVWDWIPPSYEHRGLFWWRSQLSIFLFKPKPSILGNSSQ